MSHLFIVMLNVAVLSVIRLIGGQNKCLVFLLKRNFFFKYEVTNFFSLEHFKRPFKKLNYTALGTLLLMVPASDAIILTIIVSYL